MQMPARHTYIFKYAFSVKHAKTWPKTVFTADCFLCHTELISLTVCATTLKDVRLSDIVPHRYVYNDCFGGEETGLGALLAYQTCKYWFGLWETKYFFGHKKCRQSVHSTALRTVCVWPTEYAKHAQVWLEYNVLLNIAFRTSLELRLYGSFDLIYCAALVNCWEMFSSG